ncbi:chorismate mutase [Desulfovibrio sp. OttesenSCG-928-F07]|nr:chorismate mutase [Desulfovibrio sp. OttesenSCG-928-F07]
MPHNSQPTKPYEDELSYLRSNVNELDKQILGLLNLRTACILRIGTIKSEAGLPVHVPEREEEVLHRLALTNTGPLQNEHLQAIYKVVFESSHALQNKLREQKPAQL